MANNRFIEYFEFEYCCNYRNVEEIISHIFKKKATNDFHTIITCRKTGDIPTKAYVSLERQHHDIKIIVVLIYDMDEYKSDKIDDLITYINNNIDTEKIEIRQLGKTTNEYKKLRCPSYPIV